MLLIKTNLSERRFLSRIDNMCKEHKPFDKGYRDLDVFVIKRNRNKFRLGRHVSLVGRTDGYLSEFIFGEYVIGPDETVSVRYRFGKPFAFIFPFVLMIIIAVPIFFSLLYDVVCSGDCQWGALVLTAFFTFGGTLGVCYKSKKARMILEEYLYKICFPKTHNR